MYTETNLTAKLESSIEQMFLAEWAGFDELFALYARNAWHWAQKVLDTPASNGRLRMEVGYALT